MLAGGAAFTNGCRPGMLRGGPAIEGPAPVGLAGGAAIGELVLIGLFMGDAGVDRCGEGIGELAMGDGDARYGVDIGEFANGKDSLGG